jgi:hypothetical protein
MGSLYLAHTNGEKQLELRTYESRGTYFLTLEDASTSSRNDLRYWCDKENGSAMSSDSKHRLGCVMYRHKMGNISRKGELLTPISAPYCTVSEAQE